MKYRLRSIQLTIVFSFFLSITLIGQVRLPKLISDGMVLQRETNVRIWGWAAVNEKVSINFHDSVYQTTTNEYGKWEVKLSKLKAGGPFEMVINATNTLTIKNILIGDIWVCSGHTRRIQAMRFR